MNRLMEGVVLLAVAALIVLAPIGGDADGRPQAVGHHGFPDVGKPLFTDFGGSGDEAQRWGEVSCADPTRAAFHAKGGDEHPRATGGGQRAPGYQRLTVRDGDEVSGERCELGQNNAHYGPTVLYHDGQRRITYVSLRLRPNFPLYGGGWQVVTQMKQTQPSDGGSGTPVLELDAFDGRWRLGHTGEAIGVPDDSEVWSAPAERNRWVRFAFNIRYSADPRVGTLRVFADLNGDGDARDKHERSDQIHLATLKREESGDDSDGLVEGQAIPSHLRVGIYHDDAYSCPGTECSIDVDNVGVYQP